MSTNAVGTPALEHRNFSIWLTENGPPVLVLPAPRPPPASFSARSGPHFIAIRFGMSNEVSLAAAGIAIPSAAVTMTKMTSEARRILPPPWGDRKPRRFGAAAIRARRRTFVKRSGSDRDGDGRGDGTAVPAVDVGDVRVAA